MAVKAGGRREVAPVLPMLVTQTRMSLVGLFRVPAFSVSTLVLPVMFFSFFGL